MTREQLEDKQILNLAMQGKLLEQIDEYRFRHKFYTRSEAIRYLLEYALSKDPAPGQEGAPRTRAQDAQRMVDKMREG
jgi:Arc/MetJ-type ribon-helix-helix transcriptional regulator